MKLGTVLYYVAGSCGDLLSAAWTLDTNIIAGSRVSGINDAGRIIVELDESVVEQFPKQPFKHWYSRDWSTADCEKLAGLGTEFLIHSTNIEQAMKLKNYFGDKVNLVGINYDESLKDFVLDNFCTKILDFPDYLTKDDIGENFLNAVAKTLSEREKFIKLGKDGLLGAWYKDQAVKGNVHFPPNDSIRSYDVTVNLSDILSTLSFSKIITDQLKLPLTPSLISFHKLWLSKQNLK